MTCETGAFQRAAGLLRPELSTEFREMLEDFRKIDVPRLCKPSEQEILMAEVEKWGRG